MTTHELKIYPSYFQMKMEGNKNWELRENDRGFKTGDLLILKEWNPVLKRYSGRQIIDIVTAVTGANELLFNGQNVLPENYALLSTTITSITL